MKIAREVAEERYDTDSEDDWYSGSDDEDAFMDETMRVMNFRSFEGKM